MIKFCLLVLAFFVLTCLAHAQEPVRLAWIVTSPATGNEKLARVQPEVHSVALTEHHVELHSAGLSLYYLGPFQTPGAPTNSAHQFRFRLSRHPQLEPGTHASIRPDAVGVFVNGLPIYNRREAASYREQNLWHFDVIAASDDGTWTAAGRPRANQHGFALGLIEKLIADGSRHSPIIGYAFDGYPIYGPWGWANDTGSLQRMRSGYRLRPIKERTRWPDGTELAPGQYGPLVDDAFPLGTFIEDYEFAPETGDLDEFNGRFVRTPEYPNGTYAYFLTTDAMGRLAFPYLLASHYRGRVGAEELRAALRDGEEDVARNAGQTIKFDSHAGLTLRTDAQLTAGQPVRLSFQARDQYNQPLRFLEYVHERPLHLIVVSEDLAEFDHIHPQLVAGDHYEVAHTFRRSRRYRLYADFTPPGAGRVVAQFALKVKEGKPERGAEKSQEIKKQQLLSSSAPLSDSATSLSLTASEQGLRVTLTTDKPLRAGEDARLKFSIADVRTGEPANDLQPYLGAAAHFIVVSENLQDFIHAHPFEQSTTAVLTSALHQHAPGTQVGPEISAAINFSCSGHYKLWAQFRRDDQIITMPFLLPVAERGFVAHRPQVNAPSDAIHVRVTASGYEPACIAVEAGQPIKLAFTRAEAAACGGAVVFPALGLRRELPLGETIVIELVPQRSGTFGFACGMGMLKGAVVVKE